MEDQKIIRVPDVIPFLQCSLHELVEHVHVDIHEELARQISEWKTDVYPPIYMKTADDLLEKPKRIVIGDVTAQDIHQNPMIDIGKKLPDVALEYPRGFRIVTGNLACELPEPTHCPMCSLVFATGIGIVDKQAVEEWI